MMNSFNHYSLGSVGQWLYEYVAGIRALEPGYARVLIAPEPGDARQGHQQAHSVLRSLPPCDKPSGDERPADRDVHGCGQGQRIRLPDRDSDREQPESGSERRQRQPRHVPIVA